MIYSLPMMGPSAVALTRVSFRRSSAVVSSKMVSSLMGSTGRPRLFSDNSFNTHGNKRFTPEVRRRGNESTDDDVECECCKLRNQAWLATYKLNHKTDALHFKIAMPGVDKKNVKVYVEDNFVVCVGVGELDPDFKEDDEKEEKTPKKYSLKVHLGPLRFYKVNSIEYELKNGILKVKVPRVKHEERTDILHVQVK